MGEHKKQERIPEIKEILIDLIKNDSEVKKYILQIISEENKSNTKCTNEKEISKLKKELSDKETKIEQLKKDISDKNLKIEELEKEKSNNEILIKDYLSKIDSLETSKSEITNIKEKLENKNKEFEKCNEIIGAKVSKYEMYFKDLYNIYSDYIKLDEDILNSYNLVINRSNPLLLILSLANIDKLKLFFEKIQIEYKKYDEGTLSVLNKVFDFAFEQFKCNNPEYFRINAKVGENFDIDEHMRTSESLPVGTIKRIIIDGYANETGTRKVKSYVEIG